MKMLQKRMLIQITFSFLVGILLGTYVMLRVLLLPYGQYRAFLRAIDVVVACAVGRVLYDGGYLLLHAGSRAEEQESENLRRMMQYKLHNFADSFQRLAVSLFSLSAEEAAFPSRETGEFAQEVPMQLCGYCENSAGCQEQVALRGFRSRMRVNYRVFAGQMREVGEIVGALSDRLPNRKNLPIDLQERLERALFRNRVMVSALSFYERYDGRLEIYLKARTRNGRYVTAGRAAEIISHVVGYRVLPREECRKVIPHEKEEFLFEEQAKLKAYTGIARLPKAGEEISGDTFSCMYLPGGELFLALSDGMGSGMEAYEESERVIGLLEQMAEAGFSEGASVRLINSIYMTREDARGFATADVAVLNLYRESCQFVKCGAGTTYFCHAGEIKRVEGAALPVGVLYDLEPYMRKDDLAAGDFIVMMTDGVTDSFLEEEETLEDLLAKCLRDRMEPQEAADFLLARAVARSEDAPRDDLSVVAVRICA